jgi:outer membrane protein assembly factor BamD
MRRLMAICIVALGLSGCSLWDSTVVKLYDDTIGRFVGGEEDELPAAQLMAEGIEKYEKGYYEEATEAFQKVKDRYPYSQYALEAELRMADSLFQQELYNEAYDAYKEFERLHPKNENIPYAIYRQGMSHFKQISTMDRDQSPTLRARDEFERLIQKFPENEYAAMARARLRECYISLAEYEVYVGNFYYKKRNYQAAINRYEYVLENYPDVGQYYKALENLRRAKEKLAEQEAEE